jgi:hypothetical protein
MFPKLTWSFTSWTLEPIFFYNRLKSGHRSPAISDRTAGSHGKCGTTAEVDRSAKVIRKWGPVCNMYLIGKCSGGPYHGLVANILLINDIQILLTFCIKCHLIRGCDLSQSPSDKLPKHIITLHARSTNHSTSILPN